MAAQLVASRVVLNSTELVSYDLYSLNCEIVLTPYLKSVTGIF
jgi:hypothetical protein